MALSADRTNMSIGQLGNASLIVKRKFQWGISFKSTMGGCFQIPEHFVKLAARPNISFEATELNFLNERTYIPGKPTWEPINVTFYDVAGSANQGLFAWLLSVYDFSNTNKQMGTAPRDYTATATLNAYSGSGQTLETWTLENVWPESINFGDVDYSSSEEMTIELSLRYTKAKYDACGTTLHNCGYTFCS
jgi:hypothetical protein